MHGDLVRGDQVLVAVEKRHEYMYPDPSDNTRTCSHCDLAQTKPWKAHGSETACPGR